MLTPAIRPADLDTVGDDGTSINQRLRDRDRRGGGGPFSYYWFSYLIELRLERGRFAERLPLVGWTHDGLHKRSRINDVTADVNDCGFSITHTTVSVAVECVTNSFKRRI